MSWKSLLLALFFSLSLVMNISATDKCKTGCLTEKAKVEENCLQCICSPRGIEITSKILLKDSVFLYEIPEMFFAQRLEKNFVYLKLKPPNKYLLN